MELDKIGARQVIESVERGNPPEYGFQYFTTGLDVYLDLIKEEYLENFIREGGSTFKMVVGHYGEGKTHFLYSIRELAWEYNYLVSYIALNVEHTPFHKLELVYQEIVKNLILPTVEDKTFRGFEKGIDVIIKKWYIDKYAVFSKSLSDKEEILEELKVYLEGLNPYESKSFRNAIKNAFLSLAQEKEEDFDLLVQWLEAENPPKSMLKNFKVFEKIDKSTAFRMIRSLTQWIRDIGYSGIVVLMDEAESTPSISSKQKSVLLNNLRSLIDECSQTNFRNSMWIYAVPDENFLEGRSQIYEALRQRLDTKFDEEINPTGVKIYLERLSMEPLSFLREVGKKLSEIYQIAYDINFDEQALSLTIDNIAKISTESKFSKGYKRIFVQNIIKAFHKLRKTGEPVKAEDFA